MTPDPDTHDPEPQDVAAAELALGLLDGEERAAALRRVLAEPAFAAEVERWRLYFAQLFDLWPETEAPEGLIDRIDESLGGPKLSRTRRAPWPLIAVAMSALAAVLLVVIALRPAPTPLPAPVPQVQEGSRALLIAALGDAKSPIAAAYHPENGLLRIAAAPTVPSARVAQLWAIGGDGVPHPLGLLTAAGTELRLAAADRARLVPGTTLAISVEPTGGSPTGLPTGPVVATGALSAV